MNAAIDSAAGNFSPLDRHFAQLMCELADAPSEELALAARLVSHTREHGHICLRLDAVSGQENELSDLHISQKPPLQWWIQQLKASGVVGAPGEFLPLILDDNNRLYLRRYWEYEQHLVRAIQQRAGMLADDVNAASLAEELNRFFPETSGEINWQKLAAFAALTRRFCVITGGPGTGKTRTLVFILALLLGQARGRSLRIALCAPTGKAAARLKESIHAARAQLNLPADVDARMPDDATTIHRLLGSIPNSPYFRHNRDNPLAVDVVIVDESSMVDLALMAKLFEAVPESARIVLAGDKDQLASVEAGAVLGDICNSSEAWSPGTALLAAYGKATGEKINSLNSLHDTGLANHIVALQKNHRFGDDSGIFQISRNVNRGDASGVLAQLQTGQFTDFSAKPLPRPSGMRKRLTPMVLEKYTAYLQAGSGGQALQAFGRFRILCALRGGPFGVETANRLVEEILCDAGLIEHRRPWYAGRPIMITRNDHGLRLYNGDIGIVLASPEHNGELRACFPSPDGRLRWILLPRLPSHETAFAMTVHKSQGSEFQQVLLLLPDQESPVLTRELVYTGLTRARETVEMWFDERVFAAAIGRSIARNSGLRDALWGTSRVA